MRTSQYLLTTQKETPADAEVVSHQLMLRAGMIKKLASGLYSWLPLGLRVLRKVENIVREEMNRSSLEILMPSVQPAELWQETGRWDKFGPLLLKITDQNKREFCYGPTHEEVVTDIVRNEIHSYKQLPLTLYQIQTKFRDEIRPRFGVMRAREFLMKDAYSFHLDQKSLEQTYQVMYQTYSKIFDRIGLKYRAVFADTGSIGGAVSQEFHVLADSGEDLIFYSDESHYAANVEQAEAIASEKAPKAPSAELKKVDTGTAKTIEEVSQQLKTPPEKILKTLIVKGTDNHLIALVLRGDHVLNPIKAEKHPLIASPLRMASDQEIQNAVGCAPGYLGPIGLKIPVIVDRSAAVLSDFVCGANESQQHYINANWTRDASYTEIADLRNVIDGDLSPDGKGRLHSCRGIEVGHIFQLGDNYSRAMHATVLDEQGKATTLLMGCYGIGVSRIVAAAIEQNNDKNGIIWPENIAPFQVALVPIGMHKSQRVKDAADAIYKKLIDAGIEVLFNDRDERPGAMFADMDLIGIPHRLVIGERGLDNGTIEYKYRHDEKGRDITLGELEKMIAKGKLDFNQ